MLRPCWPPLKRESHLLMLVTGDARHKTCSSLLKCQESQQRTVNMTQTARIAHWKCWIKTTTHQFGLMSTLMDHDAAVRNSWRGIHICFSNGKTLLRSLAAGALSSNYRAERAAPHETAILLSTETLLSSLPTANLLFKAYSHPESS